jgi:putative colanic acid biosynthesis UDP-glucose lipid carrier transferase
MLETTDVRELSFKRKAYFEKNPVVLRDYIEKRHRYLGAKSVFDIVVSALVILFLFSWLFPILFLLIKLDSRGPVFFRQRRVGFLGRSFSCIKFRTMYVNPEANTLQAEENDPRITRLGKFLRKSNLDELPQFLNVLMGQMSIVGPRPHMHRDCENFSKVVETYKLRHIARPGITGLAQVKGYRGPAHDFDRIFKRYQWDAFYIRNANFWLDLRIIRKTVAQTIGFIFSKLFVADRDRTEVPAEATNLVATRA